jgi:CubicO group peptidase (beta-lactamase class C family)
MVGNLVAGDQLKRSRPEDVGIPRSSLVALLERVEEQEIELHSIFIVRHGKVAFEASWAPYDPETPHLLYSLSKSFTSTAVGFAVGEHLLDLDDPVVSFFPDKLPSEISQNLQAMTVRHLLTMSAGQDLLDRTTLSWDEGSDWVREFLAHPVSVAPGTQFVYSSMATFMCSAILKQVTGIDLVDYLMPRLFTPLGIERPEWLRSPEGIRVGGWGLSLTAESIAKFGQLYLQNGVWNGVRLIAPDWIALATSKQISNDDGSEVDWKQGYGFQFWRCQHGAYRGDGAFGQFCVVCPEQDMVIAITASVDRMQTVLDLIWDLLIPALSEQPLPEEPDQLSVRVRDLKLKGPSGNAKPLPRLNDSIFEPEQDSASKGAWKVTTEPERIVITFTEAEQSLRCEAGIGTWLPSTAVFEGNTTQTSGKAGWVTPSTLEVEFHDLESPFRTRWIFEFSDDQLKAKFLYFGRFGDPEGPEFLGISR